MLDDDVVASVSTEKQRTALAAQLDSMEDWLYEDGEHAPAAESRWGGRIWSGYTAAAGHLGRFGSVSTRVPAGGVCGGQTGQHVSGWGGVERHRNAAGPAAMYACA